MATDPLDDVVRTPGPSVVRFGFDVLDRVEQAVAMVKERLKRVKAALEGAGFVHSVKVGIHIFVDGPHGKVREAVHILFAGEPVKPADSVAGIASRDTVIRMKKTDRPKDWPLVNALAIQAHYAGDPAAVLHLRDHEILREAWRQIAPESRESAMRERPLLRELDAVDDLRLERLLLVEEMLWQCVNRERYMVYQRAWKDFYRAWQQDQVGEWPTAEPSLQQHERVCDAVRGYGLPSARLATVADRQAIYDRGLTRAAALAAASPQELETIAVPLDIILP